MAKPRHLASVPELDADLLEYVRVVPMSIAQLFCGTWTYALPWAQRSYAWHEEHVCRLIADLMHAFRRPERRYFLGYVSLAGCRGSDTYAVIDGQQRLITLSILLSVLRDRVSDLDMRERLSQCLERDVMDAATPNMPALLLQPHLREIYQGQVLVEGVSEDARMASFGDYNQPGERMMLNRQALAAALDKGLGVAEASDPNAGAAVLEFADFLLSRCVIIVETSDRETEALQLLATEETTGLPFDSSERAKVTLVGVVPSDQQVEAAEIWDNWHGLLGSEQIGRLLSAIRIQAFGEHWDGRAKTPVETDIVTQYKLDELGLKFFRETFEPQAAILRVILNAHDPAAVAELSDQDWPADVLHSLDVLSWLEHDCWLAPALVWLATHGPTHPKTTAFFKRLDRLAWMHRVASTDVHARSKVFSTLASRLKETTRVEDLSNLAISKALAQQVRHNLDSRTFYYKSYSAIVLRRVATFLGKDPGHKDNETVTAEHILPRKPDDESQWVIAFKGKKGVTEYSDRIGNFAHLTKADNQLCANRDWTFKQRVLLEANFTLAGHAARYSHWTPATIRERSHVLIETFFNGFETVDA